MRPSATSHRAVSAPLEPPAKIAPAKAAPAEAEFCTVEELAARLRVTKATIYRMARRGELPYYAIGRAMRFRLADVEAFLNRCRTTAPTE